MSESFDKLKKKFMLAAAAKSVAAGVSFGLFASGLLLLILKLTAVSIHPAFYVLVGVGGAAIAGAGMFFLLRPTDIKIAKKLDGEYGLCEKVQTMVECFGRDGDMIELQRRDTSERLAGVSANGILLRRVWQYAVAAVVAIALFFTAIFIPAVTHADADTPANGDDGNGGGDVTDIAWEYDLYMQAAMGQLLGEIREDSILADDERETFVALLVSLDETLKDTHWESDMKTAVTATVALIDAVAENANSYRKLSLALATFETRISESFVKGVTVFNTSGVPLTLYVQAPALYNMLSDYGSIETILDEAFKLSANELRGDLDGDELYQKITEFSANTEAALQSSEVEATDALYAAVAKFDTGLKAVAEKIGGGYSKGILYADIDAAYEDMKLEAEAALRAQSYNFIIDIYIRKQLSTIFGISLSELPALGEDISQGDNSGGDNSGETGDDDNNSGNGGGYGEGDEKYGSDDMIYYPDLGVRVKYGEVLQKYYEKVYARILGGDIPEDLRECILKYFDMLFSGIDEDDTTEE